MFGFPNQENNKVFRFSQDGVVTSSSPETEWTSFTIPYGTKFINIFAIGGGSGGASGQAGSATGIGGGGGGGGASYSGTYMATYLPSTIFIKVGRGSAGGSGSSVLPATGGEATLVAIEPVGQSGFTTYVGFLLAFANGGSRGAAAATGGAAGAALTAAQSTDGFLGAALTFQSIVGQAGTSGSAGGPGPAASGITAANINLTSGGAAGGGCSGVATTHAGGSITSTLEGFLSAVPGGATNGASGANGAGILIPPRIAFTGGAGGSGGANPTPAGRGGNGNIGGGGGGGGASATAAQSGNGGDGGPGLVVITCW
jgi:hypothetical protein